MRILVVGARGFVGVELTMQLLNEGHSVVALEVRPEMGRLAAVANDVEWAVGDCGDQEVVLQTIGRKAIDAIYYGPYYRSPSKAQNLSSELRVMGTGSLNVFNLARVLDVNRIIFPSSTAVHGIQEGQTPLDENSYVKPFGVYGATKLLCEYMANEVNCEIGRNTIVSVRLPSVYGPGAEIASRKVNVLAVQAARGQIGFVDYRADAQVCIAHVADTAKFLIGLMKSSNPKYSVYELGGLTVTFGEIGSAVRASVPLAVHEYGTDTTSPLPYLIDCSRATAEFGLSHRDLESGMASIVQYECDKLAARHARVR